MNSCTMHRARSYRDRNGRKVGSLCLECGLIIRAPGTGDVDDQTLEALALRFLLDEEAGHVDLGQAARRRLQQIRRRAARRQARQETRA